MARTGLDNLPLDIYNHILAELDIGSVKCLRLVSKDICNRCNGPYWFKCFKTWQTSLTVSGLSLLTEFAKHVLLSKVVKHLRITFATSPITDIEGTQAMNPLTHMGIFQRENTISSQATIDVLADAFRSFPQLETIELAYSSDINGLWHIIWRYASEVFRVSMSAIAKSKVRVSSLICFKNGARCGVQSVDITRVLSSLADQDFLHLISDVKEFAISWSPSVSSIMETAAIPVIFSGVEDQSNASAPSATESASEENFIGMSSLFLSMPNLTSLSLRMYRDSGNLGSSHRRVFEHFARDCQLSKLRQVSLDGVFASQASLVEFLQKHPLLVDARFIEIQIQYGESWNVVLAQFNEEQMPRIRQIYLSNIWTGDAVGDLVTPDEVVVPRDSRLPISLINGIEEESTIFTVGAKSTQHAKRNYFFCGGIGSFEQFPICIHSRIFLQPQIYLGLRVQMFLNTVPYRRSNTQNEWQRARPYKYVLGAFYAKPHLQEFRRQQEENLQQMDASLKKLGL